MLVDMIFVMVCLIFYNFIIFKIIKDNSTCIWGTDTINSIIGCNSSVKEFNFNKDNNRECLDYKVCGYYGTSACLDTFVKYESNIKG